MKISRKTDYGVILLQALTPSWAKGEFVALARVAKEHRLPLEFSEKLAGTLRRHGYLNAKRGAGGGYRLIRDPKTITLKELIDLFEEPKLMRCMHSPHPEQYCPLVPFCPSRRKWLEIDRAIQSIFEGVTLAELSRK